MTGPDRTAVRDVVPFREAARTWWAISWQTFGGPAGQIAVLQRTLVEQKRWIGQRRFLHALNYCMLLPGPEAQQLAIYTGWLLNGVRGGLLAGGLFVLPGVLALMALSIVYVAFGDTTVVTALFRGLGPAVIAIVVQAVRRVAGRALARPALTVLAVAAFVALTLLAVPFPLVVLGAGAVGWLVERRSPAPPPTAGATAADGPEPLVSDALLHTERPSGRRSLLVLGVGLVAWGLPLLVLAATVRSTPVFLDQGLFFSGTALVTFGGAYAVLAYVSQQAVQVYGWVAPAEMVRGLALAETTPGPLIMVVQFVAFLGAYRDPGTLNPWWAGVLASLVTVWVTFVPCFVFIFLGAPYVERLRGNRRLSAALSGITAAVVGVIASLAVFFTLHTLFGVVEPYALGPLRLDLPLLSSWDPVAVALTGLCLVLVLGRGWSPLRTLLVSGGIGVLVGVLDRFVG